jgi:hypothetical protein
LEDLGLMTFNSTYHDEDFVFVFASLILDKLLVLLHPMLQQSSSRGVEGHGLPLVDPPSVLYCSE